MRPFARHSARSVSDSVPRTSLTTIRSSNATTPMQHSMIFMRNVSRIALTASLP